MLMNVRLKDKPVISRLIWNDLLEIKERFGVSDSMAIEKSEVQIKAIHLKVILKVMDSI